MKKRSIWVIFSLFFILGMIGQFSSKSVEAAVLGDNYPAKWRNVPQDSTLDQWGMYNRECTSFAAYRLSSANGFELSRNGMNWGAQNWANNARQQGYRVDGTPAVGSIAYFAPNVSYAGPTGHVAWVAEVNGNFVTIEEYNYGSPAGTYHKRTLAVSGVSAFIHFKDIQNKPIVLPSDAGQQLGEQYIYRMYNPNQGVHSFVGNLAEATFLAKSGQTFEGIGWVAPTSGSPVYRLYNPNNSFHFYTSSAAERDNLVRAGWNNEGVGFYSGGSVPVYRVYNKNSGGHFFTTSAAEKDSLVNLGWNYEGIAFYAVRNK